MLSTLVVATGVVSAAAGSAVAAPAPSTPAYAASRPLPFETTYDYAKGVAVDASGNVFTTDANHLVYELAPGAPSATVVADLPGVNTIGLDPANGDLLIGTFTGSADTTGIWDLQPGGEPVRLSALDGVQVPSGIAADAAGDIFVADIQGQVIELAAGASTATVLPFQGFVAPTGLAVDSAGSLFVTSFATGRIAEYLPGDDHYSVLPYSAPGVEDLVFDPAGNLVITNEYTGQLVRVTPGAWTPTNLSLYPGATGTYEITRDAAGNLYVTVAYGSDVVATESPVFAAAPIDFRAPTGAVYGGSTELSASGGNNGPRPISFRVDASSGAGVCSLGGDGVTLSYTGAGTCVVDARQPAMGDYPASTQVVRSFTVAKAPVTVTVAPSSRTYGQADPDFTLTSTALVGSDTLAGLGTPTVTARSVAGGVVSGPTSPLGAYTVTARGLSSANYRITYATGRMTVTKAPLTVTVDGSHRKVGQKDPAFTVTYAGLYDDDTSVLTGTLSFRAHLSVDGVGYASSPTSPPGTYVVTASGLRSSYYTISYVTGRMKVTAAG